MNPDLIIRTLQVETLAAGDAIDFLASDETIDRYQEVISSAGWDLTNYQRNPVVLDSHRYDSIQAVVGRSLLCEVRDGRLCNRVEFALDNPLGKLARDLARGGFLRAESVGFRPLAWEDPPADAPGPRRKYTRQELVEISIVPIPANPNALALALDAGIVSRRTVGDVIDMLRSLLSTQTTPPAQVGAAGPGSDAAQWFDVARQFHRVMIH